MTRIGHLTRMALVSSLRVHNSTLKNTIRRVSYISGYYILKYQIHASCSLNGCNVPPRVVRNRHRVFYRLLAVHPRCPVFYPKSRWWWIRASTRRAHRCRCKPKNYLNMWIHHNCVEAHRIVRVIGWLPGQNWTWKEGKYAYVLNSPC